jgi:two-component system LytT family sensor kinase
MRARLAPYALAWAAGTLVHFAINLTLVRLMGRPRAFAIPSLRILEVSGLMVLVWTLASVPIAALARRFPLTGPRPVRAALVHALAAFSLPALHSAVVVGVRLSLDHYPVPTSFMREFPGMAMTLSMSNILFYAVVVAAVHGIEAWRRDRSRELREAQLVARLSEAELQVLRMQLQPHFLFNTLHGISALLESDPRGARRMLTRLADLLRLSLRTDGAQEVPLREELAFLEQYLEIQRMRFGDRLQVTIEAAEADVLVPRLLLQPLVENAIRHGIARRAGAGHVRVAAVRDGDRLRLTVEDDGAGLGDPDKGHGIGLSNTRARLAQLYGSAAELELASGVQGGALVTVLIPLREPAAAA